MYIFSAELEAFLQAAVGRMGLGFGCALLLEGPPGGGKTSFAEAMAARLGGKAFYYAGAPDKERDLLYEIDVDGVLRREHAWTPGPAWEAFEASTRNEWAVLLIDEVDKTNAGFDAFLLRLLEQWKFRAPGGKEVAADPTRLAVVLTSNGRRQLRPEVLRRCQRVHVPLPDNGRLVKIVREIAGSVAIPDGLLNLAIRLGEAVRKDEEEAAPSPKEITLCCVDLLGLARAGERDSQIFGKVAASYLTKSGDRDRHLDKVAKFNWRRALASEAGAEINPQQEPVPLRVPVREVAPWPN